MREYEFRYLTTDVVEKIREVVDKFSLGSADTNVEVLLDNITDLLPIQKTDFDTVRRRVEGFYFTSELLWQKAIQSGKESRNDLIRRAGLKPLSYYHYLTGSREPANIVLSRDDYLNDPPTSLVKLHDDILALAKVILLDANSSKG
jgi:hypothetical protein